LGFDEILGLGLAEAARQAQQPAVPASVASRIAQRNVLRRQAAFAEADVLRRQVEADGYHLRDTRGGTTAIVLRADEEFPQITSSRAEPDGRAEPDQYAFSVNLLARDSRADLERCLESLARHRNGADLEVVVIDNGSTDDTVTYLQHLAHAGISDGEGQALPLRVLFADHNLGFAAGRNATMRASRGRIVVLLDTSIELRRPIWDVLEQALADPQVGMVGPYGLVTDNLKDFEESDGPDVDAIEGYLMAFRRELLREIGWFDEKFRFYRLLDIHTSFFAKTAGYRLLVLPELAARLEKHPHREWYSLSAEEQAQRSKKNFDIYYRRWHHGQSLM
ncbi:MAG TPA: glycosyltransferase, partial [Roseiflexaceae bacterium]|nr:glycosyltransferase [Roseiflexaceae bacterium]